MANEFEKWARLFHEVYERLAPDFGYQTRTETREFDAESPNGKLMIAVCTEVMNEVIRQAQELMACGHLRMTEGFKQEIRRQVGAVAVDGSKAADVASWLIAACNDEIQSVFAAGVAEERERCKSGLGMVDPNPKEKPPQPEPKEKS